MWRSRCLGKTTRRGVIKTTTSIERKRRRLALETNGFGVGRKEPKRKAVFCDTSKVRFKKRKKKREWRNLP